MKFRMAALATTFILSLGAAFAAAPGLLAEPSQYGTGAVATSPIVSAAASPESIEATWKSLSSLTGLWGQAQGDPGYDKSFRVNLAAISNGTALVETYGDPAQRVTQTIYHRAGESIMATYYCAQGNQPRLLLNARVKSPGKFVFDFLDVTNLPSPNHSHLVKLEFQVLNENRLERIETYRQGVVTEVSRLMLARLR